MACTGPQSIPVRAWMTGRLFRLEDQLDPLDPLDPVDCWSVQSFMRNAQAMHNLDRLKKCGLDPQRDLLAAKKRPLPEREPDTKVSVEWKFDKSYGIRTLDIPANMQDTLDELVARVQHFLCTETPEMKKESRGQLDDDEIEKMINDMYLPEHQPT